ncbi:hypothetical protein ATO7_16180 [Oceanococcus atlanticus]|uniref:Metal-dependent hydrolase n=1 Tax=Oceanococcus atlanticus TaxID=1317117 RepID=A0A1Y1S9U0_9GAMM|nr:metal-dependent hydrolase [Oceanococcus atlanticus]ORE85038.1 hypothetical protein ATO7_16180 [Oceanococcus atlanticus]
MQTETTSPTPRKARKASQPRAEVLPTRRDIEFNLPAGKIKDWNGHGKHLSHFMNTLSILFPVGERFFIKAVRNYRDQITDPELAKAVTAFIGQEAMHGREHEDYNDAVFAAIEDSEQQERFVKWLLGTAQKITPDSFQLSATIALEHFTAIMADGLLREPRILEGSDPAFANVWTWHALEETEHKAVAYDVWEQVMGKGALAYANRAGGLLVATPILWSVVAYYYLRTLRKDGELTNARGWKNFFKVSFGELGYFRKMAKPWADYFRPSFHPWDHDNRQFLKLLEDFPASVQQAS